MAKKGIKVEEETKDIILDEAPVLETPVEETTEEETEIKLDEAPVEVIDLNNNPVSLKAVGDPVVPKGFVPNINKGEVNTLGCKDGRIYKVISKGVGMYCDNGKTFKI